MGSTNNKDQVGNSDAEARFLGTAKQTLDGSLAYLPTDIEARLNSARLVAMEQARAPGSGYSAAEHGLADALESGQTQLPESVRLRLDAIRGAAMQRANEATQASTGWRMRWTARGFAVPASAFASICVLVTTLAILNLPAPPETMPLVVVENSLVLASAEEIELYENLEFYQWLVDNGW